MVSGGSVGDKAKLETTAVILINTTKRLGRTTDGRRRWEQRAGAKAARREPPNHNATRRLPTAGQGLGIEGEVCYVWYVRGAWLQAMATDACFQTLAEKISVVYMQAEQRGRSRRVGYHLLC